MVSDAATAAHAWLPSFAAQALFDSLAVAVPSNYVAAPRSVCANRALASRIMDYGRSDAKPWARTVAFATQELAKLPHLADRVEVL